MQNEKCTICSASEPYSAIQRALEPVFCRYLPICGSYSTHRCVELEIWRFSWRWQTDRQQTKPIALPLVHARGVITLSVCIYPHLSIHIQHTAGAYAGGRSWSGCMMAGLESWGFTGAGGRSFEIFFSLVFFSVLVGGGGCTGIRPGVSLGQGNTPERERERERECM